MYHLFFWSWVFAAQEGYPCAQLEDDTSRSSEQTLSPPRDNAKFGVVPRVDQDQEIWVNSGEMGDIWVCSDNDMIPSHVESSYFALSGQQVHQHLRCTRSSSLFYAPFLKFCKEGDATFRVWKNIQPKSSLDPKMLTFLSRGISQ